MSNNSLKDRIRLVNAGLVGPTTRTNNPSNFHPMIRNDWGIRDRIRGVLGRYLAVYTGTKGPTFYNAGYALDNGPDANAGAYNVPAGQHVAAEFVGGNAGTNIPFEYGATTNGLTLTYSADGWKSANYQLSSVGEQFAVLPQNWLEQAALYGIPEHRLDAYVDNIAAADQGPSTGLNTNNLSINGLLFGLIGAEFLDHTFLLYLPSPDIAIRNASGDGLSIEPTYLIYLQSVPPYENIIDSVGVPEFILPNSYYLQLELENTTTTPLNKRYQGALNLDGNIDWLTENNNETTENTSRRYYDQYATGLESVLDKGALNGVANVLSLYSKDLAVLHADLTVLETGPADGAPLYSPFYNTLTLPSQLPSGHEPQFNVLETVAAVSTDYINILQAKAIEAYYETPTNASFVTAFKNMISDSPEDYTNNVYVSDYRVLLDLEDLDKELFSLQISTNPQLLPIITAINNDDRLGFATRLTDYQFNNTPLTIANAMQSGDLLYTPHGLVGQVTREFTEVLDNEPCHVETLMYVVKKYRGDQTTPVQTYFISNRFDGTTRPLTYYDTQIKTQQVYRYEIEKMILVFGNEYVYASANPAAYDTPPPEPPMPGDTSILPVDSYLPPLRKGINLVNSADVKVLLVPHVIGDIQVITVDSPPVVPDMSFYPLRGSNNTVKILLNASTGVTEQTPIAILESDKQYYVDEYLAQTGEQITFEDLRDIPNALTFRSDDPVDAYQLFRIDTKPTSYRDFENGMILIDPPLGIPGDLVDDIIPNRTYYYCARAVDIRGNISNPTHIFEIELVDNGGQIFLRQDIFMFEQPQETFSKSGRRFIYIEPSTQQVVFEQSVGENGQLEPNVGIVNANLAPNDTILGGDLEDKVWNNSYKIRVTSTKTGRKLDLNVTFKNSGIVNPSE